MSDFFKILFSNEFPLTIYKNKSNNFFFSAILIFWTENNEILLLLVSWFVWTNQCTAVGNVWILKKREGEKSRTNRLPTVLNFTQIKIENLKWKIKTTHKEWIGKRIGLFHFTNCTTRQIACISIYFSLFWTACMWITYGCYDAKSNSIKLKVSEIVIMVENHP